MFQSTTRVLLVTAVVLWIPLLAMLVTEEVAWDLIDFVDSLHARHGLSRSNASERCGIQRVRTGGDPASEAFRPFLEPDPLPSTQCRS
jgi:hypothetical protein